MTKAEYEQMIEWLTQQIERCKTEIFRYTAELDRLKAQLALVEGWEKPNE